MYDLIQGIEIPKRKLKRPLTNILNKWRKFNINIAKDWVNYNDAPWWNNERSSLSILAGAIWNTDNIVFEEFSYDKSNLFKSGKLTKRKYKGRVDLYFTSNDDEFIAETKRCWSGGSLINNKTAEHIIKKQKDVIFDIKKVKRYYHRRLAILFIQPYFKKKYLKQIDTKIENWINLLKSKIEYDALAWVFPGIARKLEYEGSYYPGTAILIKAYNLRK